MSVVTRNYTPANITEATRRLDIGLTSLLAAISRAVGISVPEMIALEQLDGGGSIGPSELARRLQLTTGAVTALADRLEDRGYLERSPHPTDRRRVMLRRTRKADEDLAAEIVPMTMQVLALAERLTDDERQAVGRFLDGFVAIIERTAAEACAR